MRTRLAMQQSLPSERGEFEYIQFLKQQLEVARTGFDIDSHGDRVVSFADWISYCRQTVLWPDGSLPKFFTMI